MTSLRLLSYNIRRGGAGREDALLSVIRPCAPDIVVLQEATVPAVIDRLARESGLQYWAAMPEFSLGFISRLPIAHHEWHRPRLSRHAFLEIVPQGMAFRVFGLHLSAVFAAWTERRRMIELRALLRSIRQHQAGFHALVGDFNTVTPGELLDFRALPQKVRATVWLSGGRIRWRTIQVVRDAGYVDAFRALHPADPGLTLPTTKPQVRLDYLFVPSAHLSRVHSCEVVRSPAAQQASDHFPLLSQIRV
ncbi:MAG TPA: endonuclease/exonuclease/phosphatase family protein [Vicinamibacterales bacterium]|nr:endonuclease/exonuclease/phosphatase family protein [Vicinamibacterales bacterium]